MTNTGTCSRFAGGAAATGYCIFAPTHTHSGQMKNVTLKRIAGGLERNEIAQTACSTFEPNCGGPSDGSFGCSAAARHFLHFGCIAVTLREQGYLLINVLNLNLDI